ncbi:DUF3987 domain-containing protein [Kurthia sp. ISK08]|uniref:DUF3987 domain-containing protein n=1 Tax=Kurthia sp. ISK08 TaxID=3385835 RepID=UPI0038FC8F64
MKLELDIFDELECQLKELVISATRKALIEEKKQPITKEWTSLKEGAEVFQMMAGRYSDKINIDIYLKSFSSDNVTIDRASGKSISMNNPTLTIGLYVQPSVIQELPSNFSNRGLTQRFLFFLPKSFIGSRKIETREIPNDLEMAYKKNVRQLLELKLPSNNTSENNSKTGPAIPITLDDEAQLYLIQIQTEIERMLRNQDVNPDFKGWLGKLCGQILRITGLIHIAENASSDINDIKKTISKDTLIKADSLRNYFIEHAEQAFGIIGENENLDDVKYLLNKLKLDKYKGQGRIEMHEMWQVVKKRFKNQIN